jgi:hypothetical protein
MTASALVLSPDTAFGRAATEALALLGAPSLLVLPLWDGDGLAESRVYVEEVLAAAAAHVPGCGLIIHPLSLSALPPFGDEADYAHRAALAAAQLNRAWYAPLGVRVAQLFIDKLDIVTTRADRDAPMDLDTLEIGLRHVLAGADEAFCDPAALAVWEAVNGDW